MLIIAGHVLHQGRQGEQHNAEDHDGSHDEDDVRGEESARPSAWRSDQPQTLNTVSFRPSRRLCLMKECGSIVSGELSLENNEIPHGSSLGSGQVDGT